VLVIKFRIRGNLRFLSHAEMMKVFQRACVRAGIKIQHTQGFNPHPKLSLPLPRTVGIETDDDLLCLGVHCDEGPVPHDPDDLRAADCASQIKASLSEQLPAGCELLSVSFAKPNTSFQPRSATYLLPLPRERVEDTLTAKIEHLLASESLFVIRDFSATTRGRGGEAKNIDVRPFLKSIELNDKGIVVGCIITSHGSIRLGEILNLLELDAEKLTGPIRRTNIEWENN
jgi:hypothetical protein